MPSQDRQTKYANQHRCHQEFKEGDQVLLSMRNINNPVDRQRPTKKLTNRFAGPYTITKVISATAYKLDLPATKDGSLKYLAYKISQITYVLF